jgi:hypothetical protein
MISEKVGGDIEMVCLLYGDYQVESIVIIWVDQNLIIFHRNLKVPLTMLSSLMSDE